MTPHVPLLQEGEEQAVAEPQSDGARHCTHCPAASQKPALQGVRMMTGVWVGLPPLHPSVVHVLPSLGASTSSLTLRVDPAPSHSTRLQSPAVCVGIVHPCATGLVPQA